MMIENKENYLLSFQNSFNNYNNNYDKNEKVCSVVKVVNQRYYR